MVTWQRAVAETIRDIPHDFSSSFMPSPWNSTYTEVDGRQVWGREDETRYGYHYDFETYSIVTWALNGMVLLAFMNCCIISRHYKSEECSSASDVYVNGWDGSDWSGSCRTDEFFGMLTGDEEPGIVSDTDPVVSKGKARAWCSEWNGITALAPLIGAHAARSLQVTRGVEDFPGPVSFEDIDWDSESESD